MLKPSTTVLIINSVINSLWGKGGNVCGTSAAPAAYIDEESSVANMRDIWEKLPQVGVQIWFKYVCNLWKMT